MNIQFSDLLSLLGALGLFLYGMKVMSDALIELAGQKMRGFMARLTSNRVSGIATGVVITGLIHLISHHLNGGHLHERWFAALDRGH